MHKQTWSIIVSLFLALSLAWGWSLSMAGECKDYDKDYVCYDKDNCPYVYNPKQTDKDGDGIGDACDKEPPPPPLTKGLCHNIGGPNGLGANCDDEEECDQLLGPLADEYEAALARCEAIDEVLEVNCENIYAGIFVPHSDNASDRHVAHGDGPALVTFARIHNSQPHISANVDCFGVRVFEQPPEPGN